MNTEEEYEDDDEQLERFEEAIREDRATTWIGVGVAVGACVGAIFGVLIDNLNLGVVAGAIGGTLIGIGVGKMQR